jgi:hypothetical protein
MIRYTISPIVGTGGIIAPYAAAVSLLQNVNSSSIIPTFVDGPNIGQPRYNFAFSVVATANVATLAQVTNSFVFPDYVLDGRMDGMETAIRTAMKQSLEAYTLDSTGKHFDAANSDAESYREFINRLLRQIEPVFDINNMSVSEVAS